MEGRSGGCSRTAASRWEPPPDSCCSMLGLTRVMGTGFLPEMDEGGFILDYRAPPGGALTETDRQVHVIERILSRDPDIQAFTRRTGSELGFAATSPNTGDFTVLLKPRGLRHASVYEVMDRVRAAAGEGSAGGRGGVHAAATGCDWRPGRRAGAGAGEALQP